MTDIKYIPLNEIEAHPDNPRLFLREDVIDSIANQLQETGSFDEAHALLARPLNGHYQIIQGHHRKAAAKKAGLDSVPCWVREMDDDEAFMQLALGNAQDGLSPLEIGIHALGAVPLEQGKNGGGLQAYADRINRGRSTVSEYRSAAEVLLSTSSVNRRSLSDKAQHLAHIHKTDKALWPLLVNELIEQSNPYFV